MANYDYYRIFYYVAQYRSFTKAAEILDNNQPNITRCMNNLESELNCKLFIRTNRGVTLTPEGSRLYAHVSIAFEQLRLGESELQRDQSLETGIVSIGASESALRLFLLERLSGFHETYPHIRLRISNHSTPQAVDALEKGVVDFSVVTAPISIKKPLRSIPLCSFREILVGSSKYTELAARPRKLEDLICFPLISLGTGTSTREFYVQYFLSHGLPFHPDMEAATMDQILPMIQYNLGIGFYPEPLAQKALELEQGQILRIPLVEEVPERQICLIRDTSRPQSIAARKLVEALRT